MNLSNFAERLSELLFERNLTAAQFATEMGCRTNTVYRYLSGNKMPSLKMTVKMADYFHCSTDFLLGIIEVESRETFYERPPFSAQIPILCKTFRVTKYKLKRIAEIPESAIYNWQRGDTEPSIESVVKIANALGCSVDFVLGREK